MKKFDSATAVLIGAMKEVGNHLDPRFGNSPVVGFKDGNAASVVTKADQDAEAFLRNKLGAFDPTIGFYGEETGRHGSETRYWCVDPIDGTYHFLHGIPMCTTMGCLVDNGTVMCSVIYNFVMGEFFVAERGRGAFSRDMSADDGWRPLRVNDLPINRMYWSIETNIMKGTNLIVLAELRRTAPNFASLTAGYEYMLIAEGKLGARVCFDPYGQEWDYAPGSLLVEEAGGRVSNLDTPGTYDCRNLNFVAGNKPIHDMLMADASPLHLYMP